MGRLALGWLVIAAAPVAAEPVTAPVADPVLPNLLSTAAGTTIDTRFDYSVVPDDPDETKAIALLVHVQYVTSFGAGGYVSLPPLVGNDLGHPESGLLYVHRSARVDVIARAGISSHALAGPDADDGDAARASIAARPMDFAAQGRFTTYARLHAGLRYATGNWYAGANAGVELPLSDERGPGDAPATPSLGAMVAVGMTHGELAVAAGGTVHVPLKGDGDTEPYVAFDVVGDIARGRRVRLFAAVGIAPASFLGTAVSAGFGIRAQL